MPTVDVQFRIVGKLIPADHGYHLFSAISGLIPKLHDYNEVGLHPISGQLAGNRCLAITEKSSLTIRLPSDWIALVLPLAGKTLTIGEHQLHVGVPRTESLVPSARLYSRLVVIKGFTEPETFLQAAQRQLTELETKGKPSLIMQQQIAAANINKQTGTRSPYLRRTIRIHDKEVVGFALMVEELTAEESIHLQEKGIGGRRRFGCGIFLPERR